MSEIIYSQRIKNSNSFNSIYLTFYKTNKNVKIEVQHSFFTKNGFLVQEIKKSKTTQDKIDEFLKNCGSFYESLYRFDEHQDFIKFKEIFIK
jgi:hypothetical protein